MEKVNPEKSKQVIVFITLVWFGVASLTYMYQFHKLIGKVFHLLGTF